MTDTALLDDPQSTEEIEETNTTLPTLDEIRQERDEKLKALAEPTPQAVETEEEEEEEAVDEDSDIAADTPESKDDTDAVDVLSQIDFNSKTDEEKEAILEALRPATGKAFGEQRKQLRELKERVEKAEAAQREVIASDSPFASLTTPKQVDETIEAVEANIERFTDALIYESTTEYDDASGQDIRGATVDGKFYSAQAIKQWAKGQKDSVKQLGERKSELKKVSKLFENEDVEIETLKQTHGMDEDESKAFEDLVADPSFAAVRTVKPEFAKGLYEVFAKSVISGRKQAKRKTPKAKNESTRVPKGANTNSKSIVSQIQKLDDIAKGKTGATVRDRLEADRKLRALKRK